MTVNSRVIAASPDDVWDVLADGWLFPLWVVGASRMRDVDAAWPAVGSKLHHSVGAWPLLIDDDTEILDATPGHHLRLRARGWPIGEAQVDITVRAHAEGTEVVLDESVVAGPGQFVPPPLKGLTLTWRNTESLRRLAFVVEGRPAQRS